MKKATLFLFLLLSACSPRAKYVGDGYYSVNTEYREKAEKVAEKQCGCSGYTLEHTITGDQGTFLFKCK